MGKKMDLVIRLSFVVMGIVVIFLIIHTAISAFKENKNDEMCENEFDGCDVYKCKIEVLTMRGWRNAANLDYQSCLLEKEIKEVN